MSLFREYVDSKKKLKKPVVDPTGDQIDPKTMPNKPPKGGPKYKTSDGKPKKAGNSGWGELGDKKLVYKPDLKSVNGCKPAKIPTAEQVQVSTAFTDMIASDPTLLETFVRTLKKRGLLGALVAETFDHKEACGHLASIMTHDDYGPKVYRNLTVAINEEAAGAFADELQDENPDEEEEEDDPFADEDEDGEQNPDEESAEGDGDADAAGDINAMQEPEGGMDPNMMGMDPSMGGMDPTGGMGGMDPSMGGMDPNMMGMDPNMMGQMGGGMDPNMGGGMPQMPNPMLQAMMGKFQRSMMRAYQRAHMRKHMRRQ